MKKKIAALFGLGMVLASAGAALADIPPLFRDTNNNIYMTGQSPDSSVSITYSGLMKSRDYQANSCGWILLRPSATNPIPATLNVAGTEVTTASLPTQLLPGCTNGVAQETRSANFKTNDGTVVIVGRTPSSYVTIQTPTTKIRKATANACGIAKFSNSTTYQHSPSTEIEIPSMGVTDTISGITEKDGILCSRGSLYVPASWLAGSSS